MNDDLGRLRALVATIVQRVAELPDRISPGDWPEAMLVTSSELTGILLDALVAAPVSPANQINTNILIEALAVLAHNQWTGWMRYMFGKCNYSRADDEWSIPPDWARRWRRQMNTSYEQLGEDEKESDRVEARKVLELLQRAKWAAPVVCPEEEGKSND